MAGSHEVRGSIPLGSTIYDTRDALARPSFAFLDVDADPLSIQDAPLFDMVW